MKVLPSFILAAFLLYSSAVALPVQTDTLGLVERDLELEVRDYADVYEYRDLETRGFAKPLPVKSSGSSAVVGCPCPPVVPNGSAMAGMKKLVGRDHSDIYEDSDLETRGFAKPLPVKTGGYTGPGTCPCPPGLPAGSAMQAMSKLVGGRPQAPAAQPAMPGVF